MSKPLTFGSLLQASAALTLALSVPGWLAGGKWRLTTMRTECYASTGQTCDDGQTCGHGLNQTQSELTSSAAGFPVRTFPTPDEGQDLKIGRAHV